MSRSADERPGRALVVGAGISGLTAAIGLAQRGWLVDVHDRGERLDARGAALGIWPDAWRGLASIGVAARLEDAYDYTSASIRSRRGRAIGHLPLAAIVRRHGSPVRLVSRPDLMAALAQVFDDSPATPVRFGTAFDPDRGTDGYDLVVGADGINSVVRRLVAPDVAPRSLGATAWRGSCPGHVGGWGEVWGKAMFCGVTPAGRDRTNWYVAIADELDVPSLDQLQQRLHDWPAEIRDAVDRTEPTDLLRHPLLDLPPLSHYHHGRFVLIGDAAHAMAPSLGQGACQAVLDALALPQALDGSPVDDGLRLFDRRQRPAGARLVKRSRQLLRMQLSPRLAAPRDLVMRALRPVSPR